MLDEVLSGRIRDSVDQGFYDQLAFTAGLVRFPSVRG